MAPERPRSHVLETESEDAFKALVPAEWLVRQLSEREYGVDREVEVFAKGATTGFTFKVQLKATDDSGQSVTVKRGTEAYWRSLDVPVLLVSYEATTGVVRGRWTQTIGSDRPARGEQTVTVDMTGCELDASWAARVPAELKIFREMREGFVPTPIPIRVVVDDGVDGVDPTVVTAAVLRLSRRGSRPMRAVKADVPAVRLEVAQNRLRVLLPLAYGSTSLKLYKGFEARDFATESLAETLVMLAATVVGRISPLAAVGLGKAIGPAVPWWWHEDVGSTLCAHLVEEREFQFVVDLMIKMIESGVPEAREVADQLGFAIINDVRQVSQESFDTLTNMLREEITAETKVSRRNAGRLAYNLGHKFNARGDYTEAVEMFRRARGLEKRYVDDPEALRHLAGALWECEEIDDAAETYRKAMNRGYPRSEALPFLVDCLMYAGKYKEASDELATWHPDGGARDRVGYIRRVILPYVTQTLELATQDRAFDGPNEVIEMAFVRAKARLSASGSDVADEDIVIEEDDLASASREVLLTRDALNPFAAGFVAATGDLTEGFPPALIAAQMIEGSPHHWAMAVLCGLAASADPRVVEAVCAQGRFHCRDDLYDVLNELADVQDDLQSAATLREIAAAVFSADPFELGRTLRLVDTASKPGQKWVIDVMRFGPGSPDED